MLHESERERERERNREKGRDRETEKHIETEKETKKQTETETKKQTERQRQIDKIYSQITPPARDNRQRAAARRSLSFPRAAILARHALSSLLLRFVQQTHPPLRPDRYLVEAKGTVGEARPHAAPRVEELQCRHAPLERAAARARVV